MKQFFCVCIGTFRLKLKNSLHNRIYWSEKSLEKQEGWFGQVVIAAHTRRYPLLFGTAAMLPVSYLYTSKRHTRACTGFFLFFFLCVYVYVIPPPLYFYPLLLIGVGYWVLQQQLPQQLLLLLLCTIMSACWGYGSYIDTHRDTSS